MGACTLEENWRPYIIACVVTFFGGLVLLLPFRLAWYGCRDRRKTALRGLSKTQRCLTGLRSAAENLLYGSSVKSKVAVIIFWIIDLTVISVYLAEAIQFDPEAPNVCGSVWEGVLPKIWFALMVINLIRFVVKFIAAHDKVLMWVDMYSIVDHLTIVPTFVGVYYDHNWLALRFLVVVQLLKIPDIFQIIHLLKDRSRIHYAKAITAILTVWLVGSGMILILENNGDPFHDFNNRHKMTFADCFYFVLITLTTIGYGDIYPTTGLGRLAVIVFVVLALAMFGSLIPELGKAIGSRDKYRRSYKRSFGKRHVVICGGITFETLSTVVRNLIHKDAAVKNIDIVIIDQEKPSAELQAFFRRRFNDVTFIRGSVIDIPTLNLAKVSRAAAVFILANRRTECPESEDSANIMRATAIKNLSPDIRVIIQLLQIQNKEQLLNIPGWNWRSQDGGDEVICISELQMALMAQNCLAPGIVTMFSNLICMRSAESCGHDEWKNHYNYGAGHEVYSQELPDQFEGLTFPEAAEICFKNFNVLLVAVESDDGRGRAKLRVNPGQSLVLASGHIGYFIAQDPSAIKRVTKYHRGQPDVNSSSTERALLIKLDSLPKITVDSATANEDEDQFEYLDETLAIRRNSHLRGDDGEGIESKDQANNNAIETEERLDVTGTVHWCPTQSIEDVLLNELSVRDHDFQNHVIFILRSGNDGESDGGAASLLGLGSFVSPLRTSSLVHDDLKDVVFYADVGTLEGDWKDLANFPRLFIYQRTRSVHTDLRLLNIHKCAMVIVTSVTGASLIDGTLVDKRTILTTMNILSLQKLEEKVGAIGVLTNPDIFRKQIAIGCDFPMLAQLELDASVPYIDDDDDDDPSLPLFQTTPYVCGRVLLSSVLDSVVSAAFLNGKVLELIRALVTGAESSDLEKIMADGVGIVRKARSTNLNTARKRSSLALLSLAYGPLEKFQSCTEYGELLINSLRTFGLLCLGVYRLLEPDSKDPKHQKRYVITSPPYSFKILPSDRIYVLRPFDLGSGSS